MLGAVLALRPRPSTLLDIGSGAGDLTRAIAVALPATSITALDSYPPMGSGHNIHFVSGRVESLPFADRTFDAVTASLTLHHWQHKQKGLQEAYRVLKDGGRLIIGDPLLDGLLRSKFWGRVAQRIDGGNFVVPDELNRYLLRAGFAGQSRRVVPGSLNSLYLITATKHEDTRDEHFLPSSSSG